MDKLDTKPEVILVHGLWYGPRSMSFLRRQLTKKGYAVRRFAYRSTRSDLRAHASDLARFSQQCAAESKSGDLHFVGHSLGGLVILQMLGMCHDLPHGRAVLLGSPLGGSGTARKAVGLPGFSRLFGQISETLFDGLSQWNTDREIGMIAGKKARSPGRLVGYAGKHSDGTVRLSETIAKGLTGRVIMPVGHTTMLFSSIVVQQVSHFLQNGRFSDSIGTLEPPIS